MYIQVIKSFPLYIENICWHSCVPLILFSITKLIIIAIQQITKDLVKLGHITI